MGSDDHSDRWLLTYADLITLLLAFFIVMYSMSSLDKKKFGEMTEALNGILKGRPSILVSSETSGSPGSGVLKLGKLRMLRQEIVRQIKTEELDQHITTLQDERGLVIRIMESAAYAPGTADLKAQMYSILNVLKRELDTLPNHVRIEGHTDDRPIATARFPSNWELSTARATQVVRYLVEDLRFDPRRISALGFGQYRPIASNARQAGRTRNRRVDIIVLADSSEEPSSALAPSGSPIASADR